MSGQYLFSKFREYSPLAHEAMSPPLESLTESYRHQETRELVQLVEDASELIRNEGEIAFHEFRLSGSRWWEGEKYIFVLDPKGNMLVHTEPGLEGKNQMDLKDVNGKPIIRGLIETVTTFPDKPNGWYHYQWPVPGGLLPRWKSSFVQLVQAPSGKSYIVGSGMYNDRMEREFVVDLVNDAIRQIMKNEQEAYKLFHDHTGPFLVKDTYIFVYEMNGESIVVPAFPVLEGKNLINLKDAQGKEHIREMIQLVKTNHFGWVDYMIPKPGESVPTLKTSYVSKVKAGNRWVMVGCGVYLEDAPKATVRTSKIPATELMNLVHEGAVLLETKGEKAITEFRIKGSKWFHDDIYFFIFTLDGIRVFHAAEPESEGQDDQFLTDNVGRPIYKLISEATASPSGEGWVHYMYPEPGFIIPVWKSSFVKKVKIPSGRQYILGCGIYNMQMDKSFIEDIVNRAAALVSELGKGAFGKLRDKKGSFYFMDTYVFVQGVDGTELVNPAMPTLEGRNLMNLKDLNGKEIIKEEIAAVMSEGSAWVELSWYQPGTNKPALKQTYLKKVQFKNEVYIVGSGLYGEKSSG